MPAPEPVDIRTDQQTESRILDAAHRVFVRSGTAGARMQEIADEAGVNKALLHYYFRSKEKLAEAVFLRSARMLFPQMFGVFASDRPLREKLQQAVRTELELLADHPFLPGYILSEVQYRPERLQSLLKAAGVGDRQRRGILEKMQQSIDAEVEAGRLRSIRAEQLIMAMMSLLIFPHVAAPMIQAVLGLSPAQRQSMLKWREEEAAEFILRGFSPEQTQPRIGAAPNRRSPE